MRLVLQRVREASVRVEGEVIGRVGVGLLVLAGVERDDDDQDVARAAEKVLHLRVFADENGKMNLDVGAVSGGILLVSQFTLAGSIERGRRPGFDGAMEPVRAAELLEALAAELGRSGCRVACGRFGAAMDVALINDGPVTFVYETRRLLPA